MLLITALILIALVIIASISNRMNIPLIIIALTLGIVFGSDITGLVYFDDMILAQKLASNRQQTIRWR